jgi:hypothetical protein
MQRPSGAYRRERRSIMPLIFALMAIFIPRIVIVLLWLFTTWFQGVFSTVLWPVVGFLIMPTTTLWYAAVQNWFQGQWGIVAIIGMVFSIILDLTPTNYRRREVQPA